MARMLEDRTNDGQMRGACGREAQRMKEVVMIRPATPDDAVAIAEIYNQGIRARIATFETEERTADERRAWLTSHSAHYPVVVATIHENGQERVVGWASTSEYSSRACYAGVAE